MFEQLHRFATDLTPLTDEEFGYFTSLLDYRQLPKKAIYLAEGQVCREVAFVNRGCFRLYTSKEGVELNNDFVFENDWVADYTSFLTQQPSTLTVQVLEDAEVLVLNHEQLQRFYGQAPAFERFGRLLSERIYLRFVARILALLNDSPTQRYLALLRQQPRLWQRLSQNQLASYLGVTPESLSRIRKRVGEKKPAPGQESGNSGPRPSFITQSQR